MNRVLVVCLCLCAGQAVLAEQTKVFEWRDAAGHLSYSNFPPPPEVKDVTGREIETRSFTPAQKIAIEAQLDRMDAAGRADSKRFQDQVDAADLAVDTALRRLTAAEAAMRAGRQPQASDRSETAGGYSRLRVEYFDRQRQLEDAVQVAQAGVAEAFRLRRALTP